MAPGDGREVGGVSRTAVELVGHGSSSAVRVRKSSRVQVLAQQAVDGVLMPSCQFMDRFALVTYIRSRWVESTAPRQLCWPRRLSSRGPSMTDPRLLASDARRTANRLLVGWARMSCTPVPTIAQTLLRGQSADRSPSKAVDAMARGAASRRRSRPLTTRDASWGPTRREPTHEPPCSGRVRNGGVQGRDSRRPASLHHHVTSSTWRPATSRLRPVAMTRRTHRMPPTVRALMDLFSQETARTNAAEASAELREQRHEREEVDAYLRALHSPIVAAAR